MSSNLREIAERAKMQHVVKTNATSPIPEETPMITNATTVSEPIVDMFDEDEAVVMIGDTSNETNTFEDTLSDDDIASSSSFELTDEDLRTEMPELDEESFKMASSKIKDDVYQYRKQLILEHGFTVDEATKAAIKRMKKLSNEENTTYLEEHPALGVIEIDKKNEDKITFTKEEKEKLSKVKVIKLKVVEDTDLKTLDVMRVDRNHKASVLQNIDTGLSQYSVPLPLMSDYCRFKGSQTIQLIQAVRYDDATLDEVISKKASLVYNQLTNSANLKKYDDHGKIIMSYQDFVNKFLFHDLDMGLYGILVASSMEEITTSLTCSACEESFDWKYNLKTLLNLDDLNDEFKDKFEDILSHKTDEDYLNHLYEKNHKSIRVESPLTGNVYDLNYPTIGRAINLYGLIDAQDQTLLYLSAFALFISNLFVLDKKTGQYLQIEENEYKLLMETLQTIPQEEIDMIQEFLRPYLYSPKFILKSKCPKCGNNMTNVLPIEDLVFLKARGSSTEIQR